MKDEPCPYEPLKDYINEHVYYVIFIDFSKQLCSNASEGKHGFHRSKSLDFN